MTQDNARNIARNALRRHAEIEACTRQINVFKVGTGPYGLRRVERSHVNGEAETISSDLFMIGFTTTERAREHAEYLMDLADASRKAEDNRSLVREQAHVGAPSETGAESVVPTPEIGVMYVVVTYQDAVTPDQMKIKEFVQSQEQRSDAVDEAKAEMTSTTEKSSDGSRVP